MFRQPHSGFSRVPFVQLCTVQWDGVEVTTVTCNLSILGLYLHFENPLELEQEVVVRFLLPDDGGEVEAAAVVTWRNDSPPDEVRALPAGCGLRFLRVAPEDLRRIAALVSNYLDAPHEHAGAGVAQPYTGRVRIPFIAACTLRGKFGVRHGTICNLSALGVYVALKDLLADGAHGSVSFRIPGTAGEFTTDFKVTWQNPDFPSRAQALPPGCGLYFENLRVEETALLMGLVTDYQQSLG